MRLIGKRGGGVGRWVLAAGVVLLKRRFPLHYVGGLGDLFPRYVKGRGGAGVGTTFTSVTWTGGAAVGVPVAPSEGTGLAPSTTAVTVTVYSVSPVKPVIAKFRIYLVFFEVSPSEFAGLQATV